MTANETIQRILRLKEEKNAAILAHYYVGTKLENWG